MSDEEANPRRRLLPRALTAVALGLGLLFALPGGRMLLLRGVLEAGPIKARFWALDAIAKHGETRLSALVAALDDADPDLRCRAIYHLQSLGPAAAPARAPLMEATHDPSPRVRGFAAHALGRLGPAGLDAIPALDSMLRGGDLNLACAAASALGYLSAGVNDDSQAQGPVGRLLSALPMADPELRRVILEALGRRPQLAKSEAAKIQPPLAAPLRQAIEKLGAESS